MASEEIITVYSENRSILVKASLREKRIIIN
jgi:hypothetical protein